jgi:hypothetical protein
MEEEYFQKKISTLLINEEEVEAYRSSVLTFGWS